MLGREIKFEKSCKEMIMSGLVAALPVAHRPSINHLTVKIWIAITTFHGGFWRLIFLKQVTQPYPQNRAFSDLVKNSLPVTKRQIHAVICILRKRSTCRPLTPSDTCAA